MTVYVDNFRASANVDRHRGRWSHLTADTAEELHEFAARIGLCREWFQDRCNHMQCDPCPHWHYDVTDRLREAAIRAGAQAIDIREMGVLVSARRARLRSKLLAEQMRRKVELS